MNSQTLIKNEGMSSKLNEIGVIPYKNKVFGLQKINLFYLDVFLQFILTFHQDLFTK